VEKESEEKEELGGSETTKKEVGRGESIEIETIDADELPPLTPWQVAESFDDNVQGDEDKDDVAIKKMMKLSTAPFEFTASATPPNNNGVAVSMATHGTVFEGGTSSNSTEMTSQPQQYQPRQLAPLLAATVDPDPNYHHEALQATAVDYELYETTLVQPPFLVVENTNHVSDHATNSTHQPQPAQTSFLWQRKGMLCIILCAFLIIGALAGITGTFIVSQRDKTREDSGGVNENGNEEESVGLNEPSATMTITTSTDPSETPSDAPTSFQSCDIVSTPIAHDGPSPYFEFYVPKFDGNGSVTENADADGTMMRICASGSSAINDGAHFFSYSRVDPTLPSVSLSFRLDADLQLPITNDRFDEVIFRPEIGVVIRLVDGDVALSPQSQLFAGIYFVSGRGVSVGYRESGRVNAVVEPIANTAGFRQGSWLNLTKTGGLFQFKYKLRDDAPWVLAKEMILADFYDFSDISLEAGIATTNGRGGQRSDYNYNAEFTTSHVDITPHQSYFEPVSDENINGADGTYGEVGSSISQIIENGSGGDIWDNADSFFFRYDELSTDALDFGFDASVFVEGLTVYSSQITDSWAKGGLMVRESLEKDSPHFSVFQTSSYGVRVQYRKYGGGLSEDYTYLFEEVSEDKIWLRIEGFDKNIYQGFYMLENGTTWEPLWVPVEVAFSSKTDTRLLGVAVTSHDENNMPVSLAYRLLKLVYKVPAKHGSYWATYSPTLAPTAAMLNSKVPVQPGGNRVTFSPTLAPTAMAGNVTVSPTTLAPSPSETLCLLVTTGFGEYHDGSVDVYVDNGSGYGLVSLSGKEHVQGEFVVDRCYDRIDGIQIRSNSNNGWLGMVELSTDGKRSYNPFICSNCTGTMNVMPIVVDTDWDGWGGPIAMCLGGSICSLEPSPSVWRLVGAAIEGDGIGDNLGNSIGVSGDGRIIVIGAYQSSENGLDSGSVKILKWNDASSNYENMGKPILGYVPGDNFGRSVAISQDGSTIAVGSDNAFSGGQVMLFSVERDGSAYRPYQVIQGVGFFVSLSADGKVLAASGLLATNENKGYVKVFRLDQDSLEYLEIDQISGDETNDLFGFALAVSGDGTTVAIGSPWVDSNGTESGQAKVYRFDEQGKLNQIGQDIIGGAEYDYLGWSVALSDDGNTFAVTAPLANGLELDVGVVRVLQYDEGVVRWEPTGQDITGVQYGDHYGESVSLSSDGKILALGSIFCDFKGENSGCTLVFYWDEVSTDWKNLGNIIMGDGISDEFGKYVSLSSDGTTLAASGWLNDSNGVDSGHVKVYKLENMTRLR